MKYKLHIDNLGEIVNALYGMTKKEFEEWIMEKIEEEKTGSEFGKGV